MLHRFPSLRAHSLRFTAVTCAAAPPSRLGAYRASGLDGGAFGSDAGGVASVPVPRRCWCYSLSVVLLSLSLLPLGSTFDVLLWWCSVLPCFPLGSTFDVLLWWCSVLPCFPVGSFPDRRRALGHKEWHLLNEPGMVPPRRTGAVCTTASVHLSIRPLVSAPDTVGTPGTAGRLPRIDGTARVGIPIGPASPVSRARAW